MTEHTDPYAAISRYDSDAWLTVAPPAQFGPAIHTTLATILGLTAEQRAAVNAAYQTAFNNDVDRFATVEDDIDELMFDHPIGGSSSCAGITDVEPWTTAVRIRIGDGPSLVLQAVALRDHNAISAEDFEVATGWWTAAGMPLPEPISDTDRAALVAWWAEQDT
ncbi:hypothetical protein ACIODS_11905 [Micromonospora chalcea]|uniref:hypothetical protein n=1 Tax=Micromonospora chalcea TaxID=1874 RepID=UPI00382E428B